MGFSSTWVLLISQCIWTVTFSILFNGTQTEYFQPLVGLRQGDPLSPYLFLLVMHALTDGFQHLSNQGICRGITVS